jgi:hypothetical protein
LWLKELSQLKSQLEFALFFSIFPEWAVTLCCKRSPPATDYTATHTKTLTSFSQKPRAFISERLEKNGVYQIYRLEAG